jgi:hypothetical protein
MAACQAGGCLSAEVAWRPGPAFLRRCRDYPVSRCPTEKPPDFRQERKRARPFVPDWRYLLFRFITFLPGVLLLILFYLRTRRVAPLIVAHWPMDIAAALMTAIY